MTKKPVSKTARRPPVKKDERRRPPLNKDMRANGAGLLDWFGIRGRRVG